MRSTRARVVYRSHAAAILVAGDAVRTLLIRFNDLRILDLERGWTRPVTAVGVRRGQAIQRFVGIDRGTTQLARGSLPFERIEPAGHGRDGCPLSRNDPVGHPRWITWGTKGHLKPMANAPGIARLLLLDVGPKQERALARVLFDRGLALLACEIEFVGIQRGVRDREVGLHVIGLRLGERLGAL